MPVSDASVRINNILLNYFPNLDETVKSYIVEVLLHNPEDFIGGGDVYELISPFIIESLDPGHFDSEHLRELCDQLHATCIGSDKESKVLSKLEAGPVKIGELTTAKLVSSEAPIESIWNQPTSERSSSVSQEKLAKAEQKIREKQEKRHQQQTGQVGTKAVALNAGATANQAGNRRIDQAETVGNVYDVRIEGVDLSFGEKQLLANATISLSFGRRYGLVGRNGIGKSTLLNAIAKKQLRIPSHLRLLYVEQEVAGDDTPVIDAVLKADTRREKLLCEERQLHDASSKGDSSVRLAEIYQELEGMEADKAPAKAAQILFGLGFSTESQQRPTKEFSGGWRMRVSLAQALFTLPDLLLLDEPTNMLDMRSIYWLEDYLQSWPSTILCVSHDRSFLNAIVTDIIHMHSQQLDAYRGDYDGFERSKEDKLKAQQREYEAQQQQREHTQKFIDRFRYNANRASIVQSRLKMLDRLPDVKAVEKEIPVSLKFPECESINPPVLQIDEVSFGYGGGDLIFDNIIVNADMDSRICIVGDNGAGKSTLLKIILGEVQPTKGFRTAHRLLRMAYFTQHHVDQLVMDVTPVGLAEQRYPGHPSEFYRGILGRFEISGDLALQPVASLSGGQKSRLAFALISLQRPNFLVLDEPGNHLDVETVEALGIALSEFKGGVILVSHDERLIEMVCKELWLVKNRKVSRLEGGLAEYRALVTKELQLKK